MVTVQYNVCMCMMSKVAWLLWDRSEDMKERRTGSPAPHGSHGTHANANQTVPCSRFHSTLVHITWWSSCICECVHVCDSHLMLLPCVFVWICAIITVNVLFLSAVLLFIHGLQAGIIHPSIHQFITGPYKDKQPFVLTHTLYFWFSNWLYMCVSGVWQTWGEHALLSIQKLWNQTHNLLMRQQNEPLWHNFTTQKSNYIYSDRFFLKKGN